MKKRTYNKEKIDICVRRIDFLFLFFCLVFFLVIVKLFKIQVLDHKKYRAMADTQYWNLEEIPARRGIVYSSDNYVLAGVKTNYLVYAEPKMVADKYKTASELAAVIAKHYSKPENTLETSLSLNAKKLNKDELFATYFGKFKDLMDYDLLWVSLERDIPLNLKEEIEELSIEGIGFEEHPIRFYPEGNLAAHVLGFVASNEKGDKIGYFGIEGSLNEDLSGKPGRIIEQKDANGSPILAGAYKKVDPINGRDVVLTINRSVQYIVEKKLKEGVEKYDAVSGTVIVMNPETGEIIAMANYPTYYPEKFYLKEDAEVGHEYRKLYEKRNLAIAELYEPGSVIKPMTVSAGLDLKLVNPYSTFEDNGPVRYSDYTINNWDGRHHGTQNIIQLLQKSNNIGAAWVGTLVGAKNLHKYFINFGLGSKTNIELEGEEEGIISDSKGWSDIALANASFGQGISSTPLQVINAVNTIANGGKLIQPRIISKVIDDGKEVSISTREVHRVITEDTSKTMVDLLEKAVEGGEAKYFVLKDYKIAGKTGTAQIPEKGSYAKDKTNATFVGFLSGDKKISMIVKLQEPHKSIYAAETAVPLWMDIISELVRFYGIAPDKEAPIN